MAQLPFAFRTAELTDTQAIVELVESAYRGEISRTGWTTEADLLDGQRTDADEVSSIIRDPAACITLAFDANDLVGSVMIRSEGTSSYLGMLAIRPERQAQGIGRLLMAEAERKAQLLFSAVKMRMTVIVQREELIRWYERRGYRRTTLREPFPYGNPRFGLPKRSDLEFLVLEKMLGG